MLETSGTIVVVIYMLAMLGVGFVLRNFISSEEDFYLASRRLTLPLAMATIMATWYGAGGLIGCAEVAFLYGISVWFSWSVGAHLARIPLAIWVGPKVRKIAGTTLPDLMEKLYSRPVALIAMFLILVSASQPQQVMGMGIIGTVAWGIDPTIVMGISVLIVCIYTFFGGMWSVTVTDAIQFFFMTSVLVAFLPPIWEMVGGFSAMTNALPAAHFHPLEGMPLSQFIVFLLMGLMVYADPLFYQRFAAADKPSTARRALLICISFWPAYDAINYLLGMLARVQYPDMQPGVATLALILGNVHPIIGGLFVSSLLAAVMSTLDSTYLVGGVTLSHDLYAKIKKNATEKELLIVSQIGIFLVGLLSFLVATRFQFLSQSIIFMLSLWTATAFVPVMGGLFWPYKKTSIGGGASFLTGFILMIVFEFFVTLPKPLTPFLVAFPLSFIAFVVGNMFGQSKVTTI